MFFPDKASQNKTTSTSTNLKKYQITTEPKPSLADQRNRQTTNKVQTL